MLRRQYVNNLQHFTFGNWESSTEMSCEFCLVVWIGLVHVGKLFSGGSNASPFCAACNVHLRLNIGEAMVMAKTFPVPTPVPVPTLVFLIEYLSVILFLRCKHLVDHSSELSWWFQIASVLAATEFTKQVQKQESKNKLGQDRSSMPVLVHHVNN